MKEEMIRVLLVDGAPDVCDRLALLIKNEGMTPLVAHDAKTALDRIRLTSPDLLVTDFRLPDLDGLRVAPARQTVGQQPASRHHDSACRDQRRGQSHQGFSLSLYGKAAKGSGFSPGGSRRPGRAAPEAEAIVDTN